jgi:hypothetical protein
MKGMPAKQSLHFKQHRRGPISIKRDHADLEAGPVDAVDDGEEAKD